MELANLFLSSGAFADALVMAQWALEGDPYSLAAHEIAASALLQMEDPAGAITHLRRLTSLNRDDLVAQNNLGVALMKVRSFKEAIATFRGILRVDPGNSVAFYNMAACQAQQGNAIEAVALLGEAAGKFGSTFVLTWAQSRDFDPIRGDERFVRFVARGAQGDAPAADASGPESPAEVPSPAEAAPAPAS